MDDARSDSFAKSVTMTLAFCSASQRLAPTPPPNRPNPMTTTFFPEKFVGDMEGQKPTAWAMSWANSRQAVSTA